MTTILLTIFFSFTASAQTPLIDPRQWAQIFSPNSGCFLLENLKSGDRVEYNRKKCLEVHSPGNTFEIVSALMALESNVVKSPKSKFTKKVNVSNLNLEKAFKNSQIPFFQEVHRQLGSKVVLNYLKKVDYGSSDSHIASKKFWYNGELKISAYNQLTFVKHFFEESLGFQRKNVKAVKSLLLRQKIDGDWLQSKAGNVSGPHPLGWFVGRLSLEDRSFVFVTQVTGPGANGMAASRVTVKILKALHLLGENQ